MKKKATYQRVWHFEHYFQGKGFRIFSLEANAEQVAFALNAEFHHDNWKRESLKKGKKVKA